MIIGITGTLAAGKGAIVEYLESKGFKHFSVRAYLTKLVKERNLPVNRDSMVSIANELREQNSPSFIAEELYREAKAAGGDVIIESIRTEGEVDALKAKGSFYLFAIDADSKLRYSRAIGRASETDSVSFETFVQNEEREWANTDPTKGNLRRCIELSDYKFTNDGSLEELFTQVDTALEDIAAKAKNVSRQDYISWDEYFMGVSLLSGRRSKDPSTQVGACIIDEENKIIATGYNGAPRGIDDEEFPWSREGDFLDTKYAYVCHAELNAILNATKESLKNCTIYVALFPCNECAKTIIQSGIKKVVYLSDKYMDVPAFIASRKILGMAKVELVQMKPRTDFLKLDFQSV
ncbi:MAG: AAA family ATPase [Bacteroidia bacterium]